MANSFFNKLTSSLNIQKEDDASDFYRALDQAQEQGLPPSDPRQQQEDALPQEEMGQEENGGDSFAMPEAGEDGGVEEAPEQGGVEEEMGGMDAPEQTAAHLAMARSGRSAMRERAHHRVLAPLAVADDDAEGQLAIDVYQTDGDIVIKSVIAGVQPEDLDITIGEDTVTIRGSRKKDEKVSNENYFYQECYWGAFSRSVILPVEIDRERAEASFKNGILTIHLPKVEKNRMKKIPIAMD